MSALGPMRITDDFAYHPPSSPEVAAQHGRVRELLGNAAHELFTVMPKDCREASLALTKLEEAMFWANAAIARNQ